MITSGTRSDHLYVARVKTENGYRYFYSNDEYRNFLNGVNKPITNNASTLANTVKKSADDMKKNMPRVIRDEDSKNDSEKNFQNTNFKVTRETESVTDTKTVSSNSVDDSNKDKESEKNKKDEQKKKRSSKSKKKKKGSSSSSGSAKSKKYVSGQGRVSKAGSSSSSRGSSSGSSNRQKVEKLVNKLTKTRDDKSPDVTAQDIKFYAEMNNISEDAAEKLLKQLYSKLARTGR